MRHLRVLFAMGLALALPVAARAQQWGDLEGTFVYRGTPPAPTKIVPEKDPQFCGQHPLVEEKIVVNKENGGLANVVVYLFTSPGAKVAIHPDYEKAAKTELVIDNQKCRFEPHVSAIRTGQPLALTNTDPIGHNTKADFFSNNPFNDLIPAGGKITKTFTSAEAAPAPLSCNIHPWMRAYLLVRDNPYFAVSDKDGKFTIKNLPAGDHTFVVWHETGYLSSVSVDGKATTWARGRAKVTIKAGKNSLGKVEATPVVK